MTKTLLEFYVMRKGKNLALAQLCDLTKPVIAEIERQRGGHLGSLHDHLYLHHLWVARRHRGTGLCGEVMAKLLSFSDRLGITLYLKVMPFEATYDWERQYRRLRSIYRGYGFEAFFTQHMIRKPMR